MSTKDQDLRKKRVEVSSWLSDVFGEESVPEFELNAQTIEILYQLAGVSRHNEKNAHLYVEDLKTKSEEYNADAERVGSVLSRMMLGQNSFSQSGVACLQALAQTGALLSVKDASDPSYMLSLQGLHTSVYEVSKDVQCHSQEVHKLSKKTQDILVKHNFLQKALETVESRSSEIATQNAERKDETILLKRKTEENKNKISKLQAELAKTGLSKPDFHGELVKKKERLEKLESDLAPLKAELESYASLPPDAVEAKVKIEQLKRTLYQLHTKMSERVDIALT